MKKSTKFLLLFTLISIASSVVFARYVFQGIVPNGTSFVFNFSTLGYVGLAMLVLSMILSTVLFVKFIKSQKLYSAIFFSVLPLTLFYGFFVVFVTSLKDMNDVTSLSIKSTLNINISNGLNNYLWIGVATIIYLSAMFFLLILLCKPLSNVLTITQRLGDGRIRYENYKVGGGKQFREIEHSLNKINYNFRVKENKIKKFDIKKTISKNFFQFVGKNGVFELECGNKLKKMAAIACLRFDFQSNEKEDLFEGKYAVLLNSYISEIEMCVKKYGGFLGCITEKSYVFIFQNISKSIECSASIQKIIQSKNREIKTVSKLYGRVCIDYSNVAFEVDENDMAPKLSDFSFDLFKQMDEVCKKFEAKVVFSKNVLKGLSQNFNFDFRYLAEAGDVSIYESLMCYKSLLKNKMKRLKNQFENAVQLYQNGEYKYAREQFSQILKAVPADKATFAYFNMSAEKIVDAV